MLYPTHKRYGILWGFLMLPIGVLLGLIPKVSASMEFSDLIVTILTVYMAMRGALFGARFPDIDSPGSIPARRHPFIRKIFEIFRVKHRGKYSHDFISIGVTFLVLYFAWEYIGENILHLIVSTDSTLLTTGVYIGGIVFVYMFAIDMVEFGQYIANKTNNKKLWAKLEQKQLFYALINMVLLTIGLIIGGTIEVKELLGGVSMSSSLKIATILYICGQVYIIFTLAGAYSHLVADMTTKQGVSIFGLKLAPMQVIAKIRKIPIIGVLLCPTEFKTGTGWEDTVRLFIGLLCIPAGLFAFFYIFGVDLFKLLS